MPAPPKVWPGMPVPGPAPALLVPFGSELEEPSVEVPGVPFAPPALAPIPLEPNELDPLLLEPNELDPLLLEPKVPEPKAELPAGCPLIPVAPFSPLPPPGPMPAIDEPPSGCP